MKRVRFLAILLVMCLLLCASAASGSALLQSIFGDSTANGQDDIDIGAMLDGFENFEIQQDDIVGIISGVLGGITGGSSIDIQSIVDAFGGTGEGETGSTQDDVLAGILEELQGFGSKLDIISAIAQAMASMNIGSFDMSMLQNGDFLNTVLGILGAGNTGTTPTAPTSPPPVATPPTNSIVLTAAPTTTNPIVLPGATDTGAVITDYPTDGTVSGIGGGVIVDDDVTVQGYNVIDLPTTLPDVNVDLSAANDPGDTQESGTSIKMIIGIIVLMLSAAGVVVVALVMKKNKV